MDELLRYFEVLQMKPTLWRGPRREERVAAVRGIASAGTVFTAGQLFYFRHDKDPEVSFEVANAICHLIEKAKPSDWTQLYDSFHNIYLKREDVAGLTVFPAEVAVHLLGIASLNMSGYVRQAALERLGRLGLREGLPYVILRLADWVPQVRALAHDIIDGVLAKSQFDDLLRYSQLVKWLGRVERVDLSPIRYKIIAALCSAGTPEMALSALQEAEPQIRILCYEVLSQKRVDEQVILGRAIADKAMEVRLWALRRVITIRPSNLIPLLSTILRDRAAKVRLSTLRTIPEDIWPLFEEQAFCMIWDNSPGVRGSARFYLAELGRSDFAIACRHRLDESVSVTPGLISGLSETGDKGDCDRMQQYLHHAKPRLREAAIVGLSRLDPTQTVDPAVDALADANARIRRAAVVLLRQAGAGLAREKVLAVLEHGTTSARASALAVLAEMGGWEAFRDILFAASLEDQTLTEKAWNWLDKWVGHNAIRLYTRPSRPVAEELRLLLIRMPEPEASHGNQRMRVWRRVRDVIEWAQRTG
jgi:HEAT repeat protein